MFSSLNQMVLQAFCTTPLPAIILPQNINHTTEGVKRCSVKTGEILVCYVHVYLSSNANQSLRIKVCHGVTSVESLTPSDEEFQGLMPPLFLFSVHVFVCMQIYHLPPHNTCSSASPPV